MISFDMFCRIACFFYLYMLISRKKRGEEMNFETLKKSHLKRNLVIGVVVIAIISACVLTFTRAKYRVTQSIPLVNGTINYSAADYSTVAIFVDGEKSDTIPSGNYTLTGESYCTVDGEKDDSIKISYDNATQKLSLTPFTTRGTKCYLYFESGQEIQILATINGSASSTFPGKDSNYTPDSVTCTNGAEAKFDFTDWAVEVDNVEKTTCTVDFKENINQTFADYLISKACSTTPTSDDAAKDCLVNENGYRYEGKNPNNYVLFNDELWRVIGVFNVKTSSGSTENLVKLIRNETLDGLAWNSSSNNNWTTSTLQSQLNNGYLDGSDSTCNFYQANTKTCYFSQSGIKDTARGMIESVVWNLGGHSTTSATAEAFYNAERGTTVSSGRPTEWTGKVGLMYPSDYGYAVLASSCARTTNLGSYSSTSCAGNNWLKMDSFQWTISPHSSNSNYVFYVSSNGNLGYGHTTAGYGVRPSIYLKSNIAILGGDGSIDFPYTIK